MHSATTNSTTKIQFGRGAQLTKPSTHVWIQALIRACPKANSGAMPSVEAHHHVHSPDTERNSGGRHIKKYSITPNFK